MLPSNLRATSPPTVFGVPRRHPRPPAEERRRAGSVTAVNSVRTFSAAAFAACFTAAAAMLAGAGTAGAADSCPTAAPPSGGTPDWTLTGTTGSVAVTGPTDTAAPVVNVTAPFSVTQTQVHTLRAGDGPAVPGTARVSVCYMGVNGRDGTVFDSSYQRAPRSTSPRRRRARLPEGHRRAKVGSTVAVAMTSADGYPDSQPSAGIRPGDTLVFAIKILGATT